jgi:hypothetical protein
MSYVDCNPWRNLPDNRKRVGRHGQLRLKAQLKTRKAAFKEPLLRASLPNNHTSPHKFGLSI